METLCHEFWYKERKNWTRNTRVTISQSWVFFPLIKAQWNQSLKNGAFARSRFWGTYTGPTVPNRQDSETLGSEVSKNTPILYPTPPRGGTPMPPWPSKLDGSDISCTYVCLVTIMAGRPDDYVWKISTFPTNHNFQAAGTSAQSNPHMSQQQWMAATLLCRKILPQNTWTKRP